MCKMQSITEDKLMFFAKDYVEKINYNTMQSDIDLLSEFKHAFGNHQFKKKKVTPHFLKEYILSYKKLLKK